MKSSQHYQRVAAEFGERIYLLHLILEEQLDRKVSLEEFGEMVAKQESELTGESVKPYAPPSVSRWEHGVEPRRSATVVAMCRLVKDKVDPGWIYFGELTRAPSPEERVFTLSDLQSARRSNRGGKR